MSLRTLAPALALLLLLPVACDDSGSSEEEPGGGASCRSFCNSFMDGTNCDEVLREDCLADCDQIVAGCPAQEAELLTCMRELSYECLGPGSAVGRGDGQGDFAYLQSSNGTLEIQDSACAATITTFLLCEDPVSPPADCAAELECQAPLVADCTTGGCLVSLYDESDDSACGNGTDDDGNGYVDCDDFHCSLNPLVTVCGPQEVDDASCSNGADDDGNGYIDCADLHCQISLQVTVCPAERGQEACSNGRDDDGDGRIDCADASCKGSPFVSCQQEG